MTGLVGLASGTAVVTGRGVGLVAGRGRTERFVELNGVVGATSLTFRLAVVESATPVFRFTAAG